MPSAGPVPDEHQNIPVRLPEEWHTAKLVAYTVVDVIQFPEGPAPIVVSTLEDDNSIWSLIETPGCRHLRVGPATDWKVEERYIEEPSQTEQHRELWKFLIEGAMNTAREILEAQTNSEGHGK